MNLYKTLLRPLLFTLPAETAHDLVMSLLSTSLPWRLLGRRLQVTAPRLRVRLGALTLDNPVGLAAGLDKDCQAVDSLQALGFGYIVPGSVLPQPRPGNPGPRIVRYPAERSISNCLGLPSRGIDYAVDRLRRRRLRLAPVFVNLNAFSLQDYLNCFDQLEPLADGVEISLLCPNVVDKATDFMQTGPFEQLMAAIAARRKKPLFVKLRSYTTEAERAQRMDLVERALHHGIDGFTISGTFNRPDPRLSIGRGNVCGAATYEKTLQFVRDLHAATRGRAAIKALGGISSGEDAFTAIAAGATTVELLTGLIYEGYAVAARINRELLSLLDRHGLSNLDELRGSESRGNASRPRPVAATADAAPISR